jgi:hypothetical protein
MWPIYFFEFMITYFPTLSVIIAAGYCSFRDLYKQIVKQGCDLDEYYTVTFIDQTGAIRSLVVPVWKVIENAMKETIKPWRRRRYSR